MSFFSSGEFSRAIPPVDISVKIKRKFNDFSLNCVSVQCTYRMKYLILRTLSLQKSIEANGHIGLKKARYYYKHAPTSSK